MAHHHRFNAARSEGGYRRLGRLIHCPIRPRGVPALLVGLRGDVVVVGFIRESVLASTGSCRLLNGSVTSRRLASTSMSRLSTCATIRCPSMTNPARRPTRAADQRGSAALAKESGQPRRLHHPRCRVQSGPDCGAEERARLCLQRMEQEAGGFCRLWRCRRRSRGGAAPAPFGRAADVADARRCSHPGAGLHGNPQRGQEAQRIRASEPERRRHARPTRLVDEGAQCSTRRGCPNGRNMAA